MGCSTLTACACRLLESKEAELAHMHSDREVEENLVLQTVEEISSIKHVMKGALHYRWDECSSAPRWAVWHDEM